MPSHAKYIAHGGAARQFFEKIGMMQLDAGIVELARPDDAQVFITACRKLRFWEREAKVHSV